MLLGVVALVLLMPKRGPVVPPDPERAVIWLHDDERKQNILVLLVESRSRASLTAVPLTGTFQLDGTSVDLGSTFREKGPSAAHRAVAELTDRQVHRRVFLSTGVIAQLIDAAGGIDMGGARIGGSAALQRLAEAPDEAEQAQRAAAIFLALLDAVTTRGVNMGVREGLALARKVETNMELTSMPNVFARWSGYGTPDVVFVFRPDGTVDRGALEEALMEDPAPEAQ